jgi:hypothetical protein
LVVDLRDAIGFSSFAVLGYYAVTNAAALTLTAGQRRLPRAVPVAGLAGCVVLATALPLPAVVAGSAVLAPARWCTCCSGDADDEAPPCASAGRGLGEPTAT